MKEAREIRRKISELKQSLESDAHDTVQFGILLDLVSDLTEVVETIEKRVMRHDASDELED